MNYRTTLPKVAIFIVATLGLKGYNIKLKIAVLFSNMITSSNVVFYPIQYFILML